MVITIVIEVFPNHGICPVRIFASSARLVPWVLRQMPVRGGHRWRSTSDAALPQRLKWSYGRYPRCSMYGIFTYIWVIYGVNVSKYSIHGWSGYDILQISLWYHRMICGFPFYGSSIWLWYGMIYHSMI